MSSVLCFVLTRPTGKSRHTHTEKKKSCIYHRESILVSLNISEDPFSFFSVLLWLDWILIVKQESVQPGLSLLFPPGINRINLHSIALAWNPEVCLNFAVLKVPSWMKAVCISLICLQIVSKDLFSLSPSYINPGTMLCCCHACLHFAKKTVF